MCHYSAWTGGVKARIQGFEVIFFRKVPQNDGLLMLTEQGIMATLHKRKQKNPKA